MDQELALLHEKVDHLTELLEEQRRRQEAADELKRDLVPIANHMMRLSIDELAEIGNDFELEDLLFLLKRLLRNTRAWLELLDRLEAAMGLADEMQLIGHQVFNNLVETLDELERKGYFAFMREGFYVLDRIVTEFSEEDVRALGDNIVPILATVRNMTQPEVLSLANNALAAIREPQEEQKLSTLGLLRELSDPKVKKGLARMLNMLKALADQPPAASGN